MTLNERAPRGNQFQFGRLLHIMTYLVKVDDIWMRQLPHDLDLAKDLSLVFVIQVVLVDNLDGHLGFGELVNP